MRIEKIYTSVAGFEVAFEHNEAVFLVKALKRAKAHTLSFTADQLQAKLEEALAAK